MSMLSSYFKGWTFRSTTPSLEPGSEINVFVNEYDGNGVGVANIGDTRLYITGVDPEHVEKRVRVDVTDFDEADSVGHGEFQKVIGTSSYTG
ncbi:DUF7513 family protein [Natronobacterium gregoryi]|uniref:TRAM domain-containing protein n=2 Tax=Natronobacterium gregoryi TaxID=44930 RepID=L0ABN4_NATGS|nr:hypothetical protein [Natronobacterium gregoryi]AFZ71276.1 hypothetical protein Natgr_0002 [Natronobacterium gregoryi SP2]ELY67365.1 hypothetical protein C490_11176 [Natronobacterium gregoryi SP2]PLK19859.1 TRAM domain-containing protein [Natronobacterium gregoryi SP2]SFJ39336.1 hypothetical protein SAMN05443661_12629 [Natronobacterium gregoryi]